MAMWQYVLQMRPQDGNLCLPSIVPTLLSRELRRETKTVKL